jgi:hypothetical protein
LDLVINGVVISDVEDRWIWKSNVEDGCTVKSLYVYL